MPLRATSFPVLLIVLAASFGPAGTHAAAERPRYNVLFIVLDDLRPMLGCYGCRDVQSPRIDRLAAGGLLFQRAYCQQAVCNPSRASVLGGCRPDTTGVQDNQHFLRPGMPDVVTLPQLFKNHGYQSISLGKIFHHSQREPGDDSQSWSEPSWYGEGGQHWFSPESLAMIARLKALPKNQQPKLFRGPPYEAADQPDDAYLDGRIAAKAVETLQRLKGRPFFLGVGFHKPHLPFCCPRKYWDLYPAASIKLPDNYWPPKDVPDAALHNWYELRSYAGVPKEGQISNETALNLIRGYRACVSFADALVGRVLDELDRLELSRSTIVVLWGDHGYHLGENGVFTKMTNFELGTRSPLVVRVPGQQTAGRQTSALVEFVDIYPTLADLCGLPLPGHLEGTSFAPLLTDPDRPWKKAAFSQYLRLGNHLAGLDLLHAAAQPGDSKPAGESAGTAARSKPKRPNVIGRSVRTDRWRYTEWKTEDSTLAGVELYDHQQDPAENVNVAGAPANAAVVAEMAKALHHGWLAALPPGVKQQDPKNPPPKQPDARKPEARKPHAKKPEAKKPDTKKPDASHPDRTPSHPERSEGSPPASSQTFRCPLDDRQELSIGDFEGKTWTPWTASGEAFGPGPQQPEANRRPEGMEGSGLAVSGRAGREAEGELLSPAFTIRHKYINFLIRGQRDFARLLGAELLVDGRVVRSACATEDRTPPAMCWRTWDVTDLLGQRARIRVSDHSRWGDVAVDQFIQADQPKAVPCDATRLLHETHRPQFHFTAHAHWLNDPNGLFYYQGQWHLFHQHRYPACEQIVWGHAVSSDLFHWRHLPAALPAAPDGSNASGSGLIDWGNASGLKQGIDPPILLFYTLHPGGGATVTDPTPDTPRATQCMAYSTDGAKTFVKFAGNPILRTPDCRDRDPKVFYHKATGAWIMVLSLSRNNANRDGATYGLFRSQGLNNWELLQELGPGAWYWECPDMFEMPIDGDPAHTRWLLVKSSGEYIVGTFDGRRFEPQTETIRNRWAGCYYAVQTFSDAPQVRRVQIGWMSTGKECRANSYPGMPFNQQMSVPRELVLRSTPQGPRLFRNPVKEIELLRTKTHEFSGRTLSPGENALAGITHDLLDIELEVQLQQAKRVVMKLRGESLEYDVKEKRLKAFDRYAPLECPDGQLRLRVVLDRASIEIFANGGEVDLSGVFFADPADRSMAMAVEGGPVQINRLAVHELQSVWPEE